MLLNACESGEQQLDVTRDDVTLYINSTDYGNIPVICGCVLYGEISSDFRVQHEIIANTVGMDRYKRVCYGYPTFNLSSQFPPLNRFSANGLGSSNFTADQFNGFHILMEKRTSLENAHILATANVTFTAAAEGQ